MADIQTEKAFRKQDGLNNYNKYLLYGEAQPIKKTVRKKKGVVQKKTGKRMKAIRYFKKVGLGFKTPSDAIQGNYIDKKCPFTGNVSIRGRIIKGMVLSTKMKNTIIVRGIIFILLKNIKDIKNIIIIFQLIVHLLLKEFQKEISPLLDNVDLFQKL